MNEDILAIIEDSQEIIEDSQEFIEETQEVIEETAEELLVDDSYLTLTEEGEEIVDALDDSELTEQEEEQIEEAVEEVLLEEETPDIPERILDTLNAFVADVIKAGSPGSDAFQFGGTGFDLVIGREGDDVLLAVDPEQELPGQEETDILSGGSERDRFILGDRNNPYYDDGDDNTTGDDSVAIIVDFNPNEDVIQLHGSPEDYTLVDFAELGEGETGTAIFLKGETNDELIGSLITASGLSLDADYFRFLDGSSVPPEQPEFEQPGTSGIDLAFSIGNSNDSSGSILFTGYTSGALGGLDRGSLDAFLAKYDNAGSQQWTRQIGTPSIDNGYGVDTDAEGNVYWVARTNGRLAGPNAGIGNDVVLSKYNSQGILQWSRQFGSFTLDNPFVDPRVDSAGDVVLAGYTLGDLGGPNPGSVIIPTPDAWIAKYDSDGNQLWIEQFGSSDADETFGLDIDSENNIYTTGWTLGNLGGSNSGSYDIWLAKYDTDGNQQWIQQFGTNDFDWSWDVAVDPNDNIYTTGWTLGDLGGSSSGSYDIWVAKYDTDGNQQWIRQFGTGGDDAALGIDVDDSGNYYLTGYTDGDISGSGNAGSYDAWVAKYDSDGNQLWIEQFGTAELDNAFEVSFSDDLVYVTGTTEGSLGSTNAGSFDAWVGKFSAADGTLLDFDSPNNTALEPIGDELTA
ncbi:MAG: SBBP repeat-containing protein [Pleurocapsa sp. MO_226.B13]|nr:SBBP repeat-containing protein [Pleurocapsa sp. MO_226.B13]